MTTGSAPCPCSSVYVARTAEPALIASSTMAKRLSRTRLRAARSRVRDKRFAIVDDAISAGSAVRATYTELQGHGAEPVVIGALLVLGSAASPYFAERGVPIEAVSRVPFDLWVPAECPLCASGQALADP